MDLGPFGINMRFMVLEALMEDYSTALSREDARKRLSLLRSTPAVRDAALDWFDMRWPEGPP